MCIRDSFGAVDARNTISLQLADLGRHDDTATTAVDLDMRPPALAQQVHHVLEEFEVTALVAADGDTLHVFLQRSGDDLFHAAVVAQVDDLSLIHISSMVIGY